MRSALTLEDVQEEWKQLVVEIRQIGPKVQENVRRELRAFLTECSSSTPPLQELSPVKWPQNLFATPSAACLKQPSATGTSSGASLREAAHTQDEGAQLFRRDISPVSMPSARGYHPFMDSTAKVHPETPESGLSRPSGSPSLQEYFSDQPFAVPHDVGVARALSHNLAVKEGSFQQTPKLSTQATLAFQSDASGGTRDTKQGASERASWLPQYRVSQRSTEIMNRRKSSIVSDMSDAPRSTIFLVMDGSISCRDAMRMFLYGENFDYLMGVFLMLNAISIGVQVNYMANRKDQTAPTEWRLIDGCFCIIFSTELLIRLAMYKRDYLRMKGWQWNLFDLCVVGFSVIDELTKLIFAEGSKVRDAIDELFVLKMFRLARVVRLIRMVRLIPELKSMVYLISASMQAFFWTLVLLMILIYVVAVYYTEMATDMKLNMSEDQNVDDLTENYGSLESSMFSLFQAITGGDDWRNFVIVFKGQNYVLNALVFCVYIAFATLVMLNLVTGVFVEGAQRIIREDKEAELIKNVRKLFHNNDMDHSGELSLEEFSKLVEHRGMRDSLAAVEMSPEQAKSLFLLLDKDRSGELSVEEFVQGCLQMRVPAKAMEVHKLKYDFDEITSLWAERFEEMGTNIRSIMEMTDQVAHAMVASLPEEHYAV